MADEYIRELLGQLRIDIREDFQQIRAEMASKADKDLTAERLSTATRRIEDLERGRQSDEERKRSDRRWVVAAILVPVTIAAVQLLLSLRGAA